MDQKSRNELNQIIRDLDSVINELETISVDIRSKFKGIGNERCAESLDSVIESYKTARKKLRNVNTNKLSDEFIARQEASGGGIR